MADSHQGDTYNIKNTFYKYESDDRQVLVDLLHEYSEKLTQISQESQEKRRLSNSYKFLQDVDNFALPSILPIASMSLIVSGITIILFWPWFLNENVLFFSSGFNVIVKISLIIVLPYLTILLIYFIILGIGHVISFQTDTTAELSEENAKRIANKLEKIVRVTVEIQDQIETNLARKLELDLRISDAQSALEYYYSVVEIKSKKNRV